MTSVKVLEMYVLAVINSKLKILRERVYNRCANAVQTARYLVSAAAELTACVQYRINNGRRRNTLLWVNARRDTASVIGNSDYVALEYLDIYLRTVACKSLVDSIVNYLVYKVVQTARTCRADVHTRSFAHSLKSLEHLYLIFVIVVALIHL